jgi:hypothetical protein
LAGTTFLQNRRHTVNHYLDMLEGHAVHEERLREAQLARRFLATERVSELPALLRSLLLIFF